MYLDLPQPHPPLYGRQSVNRERHLPPLEPQTSSLARQCGEKKEEWAWKDWRNDSQARKRVEERPLSPEQGADVNNQSSSARASTGFCSLSAKEAVCNPFQVAEQLEGHSAGSTSRDTMVHLRNQECLTV